MANQQNMRSFSSYSVVNSRQVEGSASIPSKFMANVFMWMFVALGVSALMAFLFAQNAALFSLIYSVTPMTGRVHLNGLGTILTFAPLIFVFAMSLGFQRFSSTTLTAMFLTYAALMGISLSSILLVYTASSVLGCFASASAMFGIMAFMGYTTDKDLTSFGRILTMGLWGIAIAFVVNFFLHSSAISYIISVVGVAVFTGLTAYDVQKLKRIGAGIEFEGTSNEGVAKLSVLGALNLYLDFINLFLMLLNLFGKRND
jgi:uncharacterized protein